MDSDGRNLLMSAAIRRHSDVIEWYFALRRQHLQLYGLDDYGCTVAHFAAAVSSSSSSSSPTNGSVGDDPTCMRLLIGAGADINARDNLGCTPLHVAARNGFDKIVKYLMSNPACQVDAADIWGNTPARQARSRGFAATADLIEAEIVRRMTNTVAAPLSVEVERDAAIKERDAALATVAALTKIVEAMGNLVADARRV